jgi:hypothetical protein
MFIRIEQKRKEKDLWKKGQHGSSRKDTTAKKLLLDDSQLTVCGH